MIDQLYIIKVAYDNKVTSLAHIVAADFLAVNKNILNILFMNVHHPIFIDGHEVLTNRLTKDYKSITF